MSSLPEGSSVLHGGVDDVEEESRAAAEWDNVRQGLERTSIVEIVKTMDMNVVSADRKTSAGGELHPNEGQDANSADQEINREHMEDSEDSGASQKVMEYLHDAREDATTDPAGSIFQGYKKIHQDNNEADSTVEAAVLSSSPPLSPSTVDDTQSVHVGYHTLHYIGTMLIEHC